MQSRGDCKGFGGIMRYMQVVAFALLTTAGCSGSSSPGSVVTPTPSPSSPTPTPATNTNLGNMTIDQSFVAPMSVLLYARTSENYVQFTGVIGGLSNSLSYLAATSGWQMRNITGVTDSVAAHPQIAFGPADLVAAQTDARYATYKRKIEEFDFSLKMLKAAPTNDLIALTYSSIAYSLQGRSPPWAPHPTYTTFRQEQIAFGFDTPSTATLPTGNTRYRGVVLGGATTFSPSPNSPVYEVTGTIDVTVNFAASTVSGTVVLSGKDDRTGAVVDLGTFTVTTVDGAIVLISPFGGPGGAVTYKTFGPAAEELGGAARIEFAPPGGARTYIAIAFATKR